MKISKRPLALALALALCISALAPVTAQASEIETDWIELLEDVTVNDSGNNLVQLTGTLTRFYVPTPQYMRLRKIDLTFSHGSGRAPTKVFVEYNGSRTALTLQKIDATTTRAYSNSLVSGLYEEIYIEIETSTAWNEWYQLVSCRVSMLAQSVIPATSYFEVAKIGLTKTIPGDYTYTGNPEAVDVWGQYQFAVVVSDWQKYDSITISGSCTSMGLSGIRATIGGQGLPYEMTYCVTSPTSYTTNSYDVVNVRYYEYDYAHDEYNGNIAGLSTTDVEYNCKVLFTIIIDLKMADRTDTQPLYLWFTGLANWYRGWGLQFLGTTGTIEVADTTDATLWSRFTVFMRELFAADNHEGEQFNDDMQQSASEFESAHDQLEAVQKPSVEDVPMDPSALLDPTGTQQANQAMRQLMEQPLVQTLTLIVLTCSTAAFIIF